jgi:hypothetical protein
MKSSNGTLERWNRGDRARARARAYGNHVFQRSNVPKGYIGNAINRLAWNATGTLTVSNVPANKIGVGYGGE